MSLKIEQIAEMAGELKCLPYFPSEPAVLVAVARLIGLMCVDVKQARWIVNRMTSGLYSQWPGVAEMRACYCSRYRPKDGIEAYSTVFPDGLPPEPGGFAEAIRISEPKPKAVAGNVVSAAPSLSQFVTDLAYMKRVESGYSKPPADLPVNRITEKNAITQADIDRAVSELRNRRTAEAAALELGVSQ